MWNQGLYGGGLASPTQQQPEQTLGPAARSPGLAGCSWGPGLGQVGCGVAFLNPGLPGFLWPLPVNYFRSPRGDVYPIGWARCYAQQVSPV